MVNKKYIVFILAALLVLIFAIDIYLIFFYQFNLSKLEQDNEPKQETTQLSQNIGDSSIISADDFNPVVLPIPLSIDANMDKHLKEYRRKAKELQVKYPDSYIISAPVNKKIVALTFDDGPDRKTTNQIIDILNSYGIKGTFFFVGESMNSAYDIVNKTIDSGHLIGNHSWSHLRPTELSIADMLYEVASGASKLNQFNCTDKLYRPPYGLVTEEQMARLTELGYKVIGWSVDSMDWYFNDSDKIYKCIIERVHPGAIVLMHSAGGNKNSTVEALPHIIEELLTQGYEFVTIDYIIEMFDQ